MQITSSDLGGILDDNSDIYIQSVKAAIAHSDPECEAIISRSEGRITFHVKPSTPDFKQSVINNILNLHKRLGIKTDFSKSVNISRVISFSVEM